VPIEDYEYFTIANPPRVVRRADDGSVSELTPSGWRPAPWLQKRVAGRKPLDPEQLERRCRQRMNDTPLDADAEPSSAWAERGRRLRQWFVPPLEYGAPRHLRTESRQDAGEAAYDEQLPSQLTDELRVELLEQARDGYERQGDRVESIERRAGLYQGGASISGGLVLTGTSLVTGKDGMPDGVLRWIVIVGLAIIAVFLLLSGWRAHQASVRTFAWARPNIRRKILNRAAQSEVAQAQRSLLTALLLAQDRGQIIADWKLARLKQASRYFTIAVLASVVVSVAFLISVI
jgi:hypothetical protein